MTFSASEQFPFDQQSECFTGPGLGLNSTRETQIPCIPTLPAQTALHPHAQRVSVPCPPRIPIRAARLPLRRRPELRQHPAVRPTFISGDYSRAVFSEPGRGTARHLQGEPASDGSRLCSLKTRVCCQCVCRCRPCRPPSRGERTEMRKREQEEGQKDRSQTEVSRRSDTPLSLYPRRFWFFVKRFV